MRVVLIVLALLLTGCTTPLSAPAADAPAAPTVRVLACGGGPDATAALETSALGSCWGHIGHHHYFLDAPVDVHAVEGELFAVEVAPAQERDLIIAVETSGDGHAWRPLLAIMYPLGEGSGDRHDIHVDETPVDARDVRFLRVRMPFSELEGLAGYLDGSRFHLTVTPATGRAAAADVALDCTRAAHLEAFFAAHPCWFGGHDNLDRMSPVGDPTRLHAAYEVVDDSWWDAPSFFHTYPLLGGAAGPFTAQATAQIWRLTHFVITCGTAQAIDSLQAFDVIAQASADGAAWSEVARAPTQTGEPVALGGELPDGTRFVRLAAQAGGNYDAGGCHHPVAYLTDSRLTRG
jgi:hypothetical protein